MKHESLTGQVIGAAIEVHRELGPGLLESAYQRCLCHELGLRQLKYVYEYQLKVQYKGVGLDVGYRLDLFVEQLIVVEVKAVETVLPVHEAQLLTYMKLAKAPVGVLFNFHEARLTDGLVRRVL